MCKGLAEQVTHPKVTTLEVKSLGPVSLKTKGRRPRKLPGSMSSSGKKVGDEWKLAADILEGQQIRARHCSYAAHDVRYWG